MGCDCIAEFDKTLAKGMDMSQTSTHTELTQSASGFSRDASTAYGDGSFVGSVYHFGRHWTCHYIRSEIRLTCHAAPKCFGSRARAMFDNDARKVRAFFSSKIADLGAEFQRKHNELYAGEAA